MALVTVKGFYVPIGSLDLPNSFRWSQLFGFNAGSMQPVYAYSVNDAINAFQEPVTMVRDNPFNNVINSLLILDGYQNPDVATIDIYSAVWTKIYKIIDAIYQNMSTWNSSAADPLTYLSLGDEQLSTNASLGVSDVYVSHSLNMMNGKTNRLYKASFNATIANQNVSFTIYYDPDYLIQYATIANFRVYEYSDLDSDDKISPTEWDNQIIDKIHQILKTGKYKRWDKFSTRKRVPDPDNQGEFMYIMAPFYVFSNYAAIPEDLVTQQMLKSAVKSYLQNLYPGTENMAMLMVTYPDLFSQLMVDIYPAYTNTVVDNAQNATVVHAFSGDKLKELLSVNNLPIDPDGSGARKYEIFFIGSLTTQSYSYKMPFIAVEDPTTDSSISRPISGRFPDYVPKFGGFDPQSINTDADRFQMLMLISMNLITGLIELEDIPIEFRDGYYWEFVPQTGMAAGYVSFVFSNTTWTVKSS